MTHSSFPSKSMAGIIPAPGSERFPGEGDGNPLQYSCLENPTERGAWWAEVHGVSRFGHDLATKSSTHPAAHTYTPSFSQRIIH